MKLLENTYLVSYHQPIIAPIYDAINNIGRPPLSLRVRASTATEAITVACDILVTGANHPLIKEEENCARLDRSVRYADEMLKFFEGRSMLRFQASDFPVMEVKVVA